MESRRPAPLQAADTFYQKAYNLVTAPHAKKAFDIHTEDPQAPRPLRPEFARPGLLAGPPADRGGRPVRHRHRRRLGHAPEQLHQSLKNRLLPRLDTAALQPAPATCPTAACSTRRWSSCSAISAGRPKVNPSAGRDHWSTAGIALLAGGGIRPGLAVGQTNALGEQPTEAPYYTEDVAATIYHCLGIPLDTTHQTPDGRPDPGQLRRPADPGAAVTGRRLDRPRADWPTCGPLPLPQP